MSKYLLDCADSGARNLHDLLDVICLIQFEAGDEIDRRVDSLLWIARDLAQGVCEKMAEDDKSRVQAKAAFS